MFYDHYCKNIRHGWEEDTTPLKVWLLGLGSDASHAPQALRINANLTIPYRELLDPQGTLRHHTMFRLCHTR
jgi:hypothetical protein